MLIRFMKTHISIFCYFVMSRGNGNSDYIVVVIVTVVVFMLIFKEAARYSVCPYFIVSIKSVP